MKSHKKTKVFSILFLIYSIIVVSSTIFLTTFLTNVNSSLVAPKLIPEQSTYASRIYDRNKVEIEKIGKDKSHITYDELPQVLFDAIVAVEDNSFYYHDGVDIHRVFGSIFHNLTSNSSLQGASTITQQLAKNLYLSSEQTLQRKIKELLLSFKLESTYEKKIILEYYFNKVNFDSVYPGIVYATNKFFDKNPDALTLSEAAMVVGLVKSPSAYAPFRHPDEAEQRRKVVLKKMLDNKLISQYEYDHAIKMSVDKILKIKDDDVDISLPYQAYLDIVYKECELLTGKDPYEFPLYIETYMDSQVQTYLDGIQNGTNIDFYDDLQQIGAAIIDNSNGTVIGLIGGKDYVGKRLFNRAYDKKISPASTIKPVFEYLLAAEYLNYHKATTLNDEKITYLNGEPLKNAGDHYTGKIPLYQALGYSKNTTAIQILNELTTSIGEEKIIEHLTRIGLMDEGPYYESYGLGGMKSGVSLINLAASYGTIANNGTYIKPRLIKKITTPQNEVLYEDKIESKQIVSERSAYIVKDILKTIVNNGYNGLDYIKVNGVDIGAKTGTGQYDTTITNRFNYPSNVDKDSLIAGFSNDYSLAVWTGFDQPLKDKNTYFSNGDKRKKLTKLIFKKIMTNISNPSTFSNPPKGLVKVNLVSLADGNYLPNELIPSSYTIPTYIKDELPLSIYPLPTFTSFEPTLYSYSDSYCLILPEILPEEKDIVYENIYGELGYFISTDNNSYFTSQSEYWIYEDLNTSKISIKKGYRNLPNFCSDTFDIHLRSFSWF